jgi:hypothetical protein
MGYLDNSSITVDAILTKKGRELLAKGRSEFKITQFALADDEVDYDLWNPAHPLGTNYYGIIIENMPLVEATPDESQMLKYKLVTLPKKTSRIPVIQVGQTSISLTAPGQVAPINPTTVNFTGGNSTLGYTLILSDSDVADIQVVSAPARAVTATVPQFIGDADAAQSVAFTGFTFNVVAKQQLVRTKTATITVIGNETGGRATISLTVKKVELSTALNVPLINSAR